MMKQRTPDGRDGGAGRRSAAFLGGALLGAVVVAAGAVAFSLSVPLPSDPVPVEPVAGADDVRASAGPDAAEEPRAAADSMTGDAPRSGSPVAVPAIPEIEAAAEDAVVAGADSPPARDDASDPDTVAEVSIRQTGAGAETAANAAPATRDPAAAEDGDSDAAAPSTSAGDDAAPGQIARAPEPEAGPDEPAAGATTAGAGSQASPGAPALAANARDFDAPQDAPLLAVVLAGGERITADRLAVMTMPLTVAIRADAAGATATGTAARAAGHEVLVDFGGLATGDADDAAGAGRALLDLAVGATAIGETDAGGLVPLMDELSTHGFAWLDPGGTGMPAAQIAGGLAMPYARTDETLPDDASPDGIRDALGRAAARARDEGSAVVVLPAGEDALDALVGWGIENPQAAWFAPLSAVIGKGRAVSAAAGPPG